MIKTELLNNDTLIRHFSDAGMMIIQNETGNKYEDAVDPIPCQYTYSESDEPIPIDLIALEEEDNGSTNSMG